MSFKFVDLFAGIGGFHAALTALGGECVMASEIDPAAIGVYSANWEIEPKGDITLIANDNFVRVPSHDVLVGGFPCQPFSKSGKQKGMDETRGTLFWNIAKIIEEKRPSMVLLENVRNLAGPRHVHEWAVIIDTLRDLGYRVSEIPLVVSPHLIHPDFGGRPQSRERILIAATKIPRGTSPSDVDPIDLQDFYKGWDPQDWNLIKDLPVSRKLSSSDLQDLALADSEVAWIEAWNEFVLDFKKNNKGKQLPGFPIWADEFVSKKKLRIPKGTPEWKENFLRKNSELYEANQTWIDAWLARWDYLQDFPPSRRKLEWQAQDEKDLWSCLMHFRPSGIRAKKLTYVPALVAITQTSIVGPLRRRISVREAARLQGFPETFDFGDQKSSQSYKQLGNAVNVGVIYNVIRAQARRDAKLLKGKQELLDALLNAPDNPDQLF